MVSKRRIDENSAKDKEVRAMCGTQLMDVKTAVVLTVMLVLNKTIPQLAMANNVRWYGHVLTKEDGHILRTFELEAEVRERKEAQKGRKKTQKERKETQKERKETQKERKETKKERKETPKERKETPPKRIMLREKA